MTNDDFERSCERSFVDHDQIRFLRREISEHESIERHAEILAMLGNPTRLKIIYCLSKTVELCVCDLSDILNKEVSTISHQLRRLKDRGFVKNRRDGLTIYYRIARTDECRQACEMIDELITESAELKLG